eukprot:m.91982 g.91982  ORF g.91982 m.91982 type:complete len:256 (-) comp26515_c0_seq1:127-894(-)
MALRRMKLGDYFRIKGPVKWKPEFVKSTDLGNPAKLGWGFVPQTQILSALSSKKALARFRLLYKSDEISPPEVVSDFERFGVNLREFHDGAEVAYKTLAEEFSDPNVDFRNVPLTSPRLSLFLNEVITTFEDKGHFNPQIKVDSVEAITQDISIEFGTIDHYNKWFGIYDREEIQHHLFSGVLPEVTMSNEITGDCPKRIVASVLFKAKEKFWFADKEDEPKDWTNNLHYLEFESSVNHGISWRLRNFNNSIKTP